MPAVLHGMENRTYHAMEALGSSGLKLLMGKSPRHYWAEYLDPDRVRKPPTDAMKFGTVLHTAVLEPDKLPGTVAVMPADRPDFRTNAGRAWRDAFNASADGKIVIEEADYIRALNTRDAVLRHPRALWLLNGAARELSYVYEDHFGNLCKARPDAVNAGRNIITDLKGTDDAGPDAFSRSIAGYWYDTQAAWYAEAVSIIEGVPLPTFCWIAAEVQWPHEVAVYTCDAPTMRNAQEIVGAARELFARCRQNGDWPGYSKDIQSISVPKWRLRVNGMREF